MTVSVQLLERLAWGGYSLCSSCREIVDRIDRRGDNWAIEHRQQIARILDANLRRRAGRIPQTHRRRWLERQIVLAIKQSRKMAAKRVQ